MLLHIHIVFLFITTITWCKIIRSPHGELANQQQAAIPDEVIWKIIQGETGIEEVGKYVAGSKNHGNQQPSLLIPSGAFSHAKRNSPPHQFDPRVKKRTNHIKIDFGPDSSIGIYGQLGKWKKQFKIGYPYWNYNSQPTSAPTPPSWEEWPVSTTPKSADWDAWKWSPKVWTQKTTVPTCAPPPATKPPWKPANKWPAKPTPPAYNSWDTPSPPKVTWKSADKWPKPTPPSPPTWNEWNTPSTSKATWKSADKWPKPTPPSPPSWNEWDTPSPPKVTWKSADEWPKPTPPSPPSWNEWDTPSPPKVTWKSADKWPKPSTWVPKVATWSYPKKKGWTWKSTTAVGKSWNKPAKTTTTPVPSTPGPWIDVWSTPGWSDPWTQNPTQDPWAWKSSATTTNQPTQGWKWPYEQPNDNSKLWKRGNKPIQEPSTEKYQTIWVDSDLIP